MESVDPLVSIVIPIFNRVDCIEECLLSAINQDYKNTEVIVVDNRSTDGTYELLLRLKETYAFNLERNAENIGPVRNWKAAIDAANGDFVKILFSDDAIMPQFVSECMSILNSSEGARTGFVVTSYCRGPLISNCKKVNNWPGINGLIPSEKYIKAALFKFAFLVSPGAAIFRAKDLQQVFEEEVHSPVLRDFKSHGAGPDLLLFLDVAAKYDFVAKVDKPLCFFRDHSGSQTNKMVKDKTGLIQRSYMQARLNFCVKYRPDWIDELLGKAMFVESFQAGSFGVVLPVDVSKRYLQAHVPVACRVWVGFIKSLVEALKTLLGRIF